MLARFARKPFEEEFKDAEIKDEGETVAGGSHKVRANGITYYLKNDRIVAATRNIGTEKRPFETRVDFKIGTFGDGYAFVSESYSRKNDKGKVLTTTRTLTPRDPRASCRCPATYQYSTQLGKRGSLVIKLKFAGVKTNTDHPVVMHKDAEALLREAWINRYVFPNDIRIVSEFGRKPDRTLAQNRWRVVKGKLLVWGMDSVEVELEENRRNGGSGQVLATWSGPHEDDAGLLPRHTLRKRSSRTAVSRSRRPARPRSCRCTATRNRAPS